MNNLIIDLEATCSEDNTVPRNEMEIIEFGCVLTDNQFNKISEFQAFVKPSKNPKLTDFCKKLTSISQGDVDEAKYLNEVIVDIYTWANSFGHFRFCSWGDFDSNLIKRECLRKGIRPLIINDTLNLKVAFAKGFHKKRVGVGKALNILKMKFEGTAHRGIDDARMIAKIAKETNIRTHGKWLESINVSR